MRYSSAVNVRAVRLEGRVRDVVSSGDAIVETTRGLVFVRGALVGEQLRISLDDKRGRVQRGRLVEVLEPSSARVEPPCPYVQRCGGCALMHASPEAQHALRVGFLRSALRKVGVSDEVVVHDSASPEPYGYRRRARLAFRVGGRGRELGFRRERSHDIADIERCLVLAPPLERALELVRARLLGLLAGEGELSLALGLGGAAVVVLRSESVQQPALYTACEALVQDGGIAGVALYVAGASKPALFGDAREWSEGFDGQPLEGTVAGFAQANAAVNRALVARVVERVQSRDARVLELYAGSGNFTIALAAGAASYTAIEQAPDAVAALRRNLAARSLAAKVVEGDVSERVRRAGPIDVVLLDPPRTGAPGVLAAIAAHKPKRVVYVSCDPATLARDLAELLPRYTLTWLEAFEMFPQTAELESLAVLELQA